MHEAADDSVVELPSWMFLVGCFAAAVALLAAWMLAGWTPPSWLLPSLTLATVVGLFVFGSFKYRIHKNALTYGMALVIGATFLVQAYPGSDLAAEVDARGIQAWLSFLGRNLLTWHGLEHLFHADTMAFILGLTFFVSVIAQTRLLESLTLRLLNRFAGAVLPTLVSVTAVVAFSSGILDGVSMIGLTIRTLVIVMFLASASVSTVRYTVMVCTVVTTVCGMWLAYGEPPNLIMKANLTAPSGESYLTNGFFLRYCLPGALASYLVVAWNLRRRIGGVRVDVASMDLLDANAESVRYLQAVRHGEVLTPIEALEAHEDRIGVELSESVQERVRRGETLGKAMVAGGVPEQLRRRVLGHYVAEEVAESLDAHYVAAAAGDSARARQLELQAAEVLRMLTPQRQRAQRIAAVSLAVFVVALIWHGIDHRVPLFVASGSGFVVALMGIISLPRVRALALREARIEFAEYYFLFPLFFSITLLSHAGFFDALQVLLQDAAARFGTGHTAFAQFLGCTFLSAILDNNVVADFGSHAIIEFELAVLHLFAMAQIAGYALGGCWTHIGSAQSVVAFAFIRREVDESYTPVQWIREITSIILQLGVVLTILIYFENRLLDVLH
ncbi:MAG TPA: SLC13 family permease [Candidatus Binatia bacterium]|nr:SLC13 family permease [Candidatus Binatia bacterium]